MQWLFWAINLLTSITELAAPSLHHLLRHHILRMHFHEPVMNFCFRYSTCPLRVDIAALTSSFPHEFKTFYLSKSTGVRIRFRSSLLCKHCNIVICLITFDLFPMVSHRLVCSPAL
ncbi:hypothetical protein TNCV_58481 [Trichonephila clavipes]|nr:hypothetical protein TNCV_58481 [Trichonephila clavipes]